MNLKYFKDEEGNYIIYRNGICQIPDNYILSKTIYNAVSILPKEDSISIEQVFDNFSTTFLKNELPRMIPKNCQNFANIHITANYENFDKINPVYKDGYLKLEKIDNSYTFYQFVFIVQIYFPITLHNIVQNPIFYLKSLFNSLKSGEK